MTPGLLRRLPIRYKLVAMIMTTVVVVLALSTVGAIVIDYYRTRAELREQLTAQAQLVLENVQPALDFNDPETAQATLATLAANTNLQSACLYTRTGALFAAFLRRNGSACEPQPPDPGTYFTPERLEVVSAGESRGQRFGIVAVRSGLDVLGQRLRWQLVSASGLLILALAVALVLSAQLQRLVSRPITDLSLTAAAVSSGGDYSLRAARTSDDELGVLVDAFNRVLERIQMRERELSKANEELLKAGKLKDDFLATLSHELRTPLNAILGWTKLLRAKAVPPSSFDLALEKVERNAQVQARLVEDLLEISRIATGKLHLEHHSFDLVALASTAIESIRPTAEARGVSILWRVESRSLPTSGDPDRLQQVIWNLLSNAVKFTPAGGTVTVSLGRDGSTDVIDVTDTGIGIDRAFLPDVFDTFRQADASATRAHGGLGLGLAIVKRLVELHGGEVTADSDGPGRGARFTVRLPARPVARPGTETSPPPPVLPEGRLAGVSVLVVDDDADTRDLLASVLESAGATVHVSASGASGLTMAMEQMPDVLVSDIAMPGMDGYSFVEQLNSAMGSRAPRVRIALSAFAAPHDTTRALDAGFHHHVAKPVDPLALVKLLADNLIRPSAVR